MSTRAHEFKKLCPLPHFEMPAPIEESSPQEIKGRMAPVRMSNQPKRDKHKSS